MHNYAQFKLLLDTITNFIYYGKLQGTGTLLFTELPSTWPLPSTTVPYFAIFR